MVENSFEFEWEVGDRDHFALAPTGRYSVLTEGMHGYGVSHHACFEPTGGELGPISIGHRSLDGAQSACMEHYYDNLGVPTPRELEPTRVPAGELRIKGGAADV